MIEHLKVSLPRDKMKKLKPNQWYWLTDRTPHKVLPMKKTGLKHIIKNGIVLAGTQESRHIFVSMTHILTRVCVSYWF